MPIELPQINVTADATSFDGLFRHWLIGLFGEDSGSAERPTIIVRPNNPEAISEAENSEDHPLVLVAGGGRTSGVGGGRYGANFPSATPGQLIRLDLNIGRTERALERVRQYDPKWQPRSRSVWSSGSIEGAIRHAQARAEEAEARYEQLRSGVGGNFPPSKPIETQPITPRGTFDGQAWIAAYRLANNAPDLFGRPIWKSDNGTVAVAQLDGKIIFGVNSGAPTYKKADDLAAREMRDVLLAKYPLALNANISRKPNDFVFHAEAILILRAASLNGGTLRGKSIEIHTDRRVCNSCRELLPYLARELGNPRVTIVDQLGNRYIVLD